MLARKQPLNDRKTSVALGLMLVISVFVVYHGVLSASFISFDDSVYVYDNPVIKGGFSSGNLSKIFNFKQEAGPYWHPVTSLSHMADCALFGLNASLHHLTNLIIHALNVLILFAFFRVTTGRTVLSFFVALFFAVHPLNVETVAWVSERKNLLAVFFFLLGLHAWRYHAINRSGRSYFLLWLVFALGIMSKPLMLTFPFALFLVHHFPMNAYEYSLRRNETFLGRNVREVKPVFQMIIVMLIFFFVGFSMSGSASHVAPLQHIPLGLRLSNMLVSYLVYLKMLVWPFGFTVFHPYPTTVGAGIALVCFLVIGVVSVFAFLAFRRLPWLFFGWFWYLGNLVTASGLMQKGYWPAHADRFTYLPMIGIFVVLVWGLAVAMGKTRIKATATNVILSAAAVYFASISVVQARHWTNAETLFRHAVQVNPKDVLSLTNLALALGEQGRIDEAISVTEKALSLEPRYAEALNNLGTLYAKKGDIAQSLVYFERSLEAYPGFTKARENAEHAKRLLSQPEQSLLSQPEKNLRTPPIQGENEFQKVLETDKKDSQSLDDRAQLALILVSKKHYEEAEKLYLSMLKNHPDAKVTILYNLACLYAIMGHGDQAMAFLQNSVREGFSEWDHLEHDEDLKSLRDRTDFKELINAVHKAGLKQ
jgi:tetratricopeptide (TPR) repeat protein